MLVDIDLIVTLSPTILSQSINSIELREDEYTEMLVLTARKAYGLIASCLNLNGLLFSS